MKSWGLGLQAGFILVYWWMTTVRFRVVGSSDPSELRRGTKMAVRRRKSALLSTLVGSQEVTIGGRGYVVGHHELVTNGREWCDRNWAGNGVGSRVVTEATQGRIYPRLTGSWRGMRQPKMARNWTIAAWNKAAFLGSGWRARGIKSGPTTTLVSYGSVLNIIGICWLVTGGRLAVEVAKRMRVVTTKCR